MADGSCILSSQDRARHAPDEMIMQRSRSGCAAVHVGIDGTVRCGSLGGGPRPRKHALRVATVCVAACSGYYRAERLSIRRQQLMQLARVCLCAQCCGRCNGAYYDDVASTGGHPWDGIVLPHLEVDSIRPDY